jgi:hypothetical protein
MSVSVTLLKAEALDIFGGFGDGDGFGLHGEESANEQDGRAD